MEQDFDTKTVPITVYVTLKERLYIKQARGRMSESAWCGDQIVNAAKRKLAAENNDRWLKNERRVSKDYTELMMHSTEELKQ